MLSEENMTLLVNRIVAGKKITVKSAPSTVKVNEKDRDKEIIKSVVTRIFQYIDLFNNLPEFTTTYFSGRSLDKIEVIDEFADFIEPESVRLDPTDLKTDNLLANIGSSNEEVESFTYVDWLDLQITFRSWYKSDITTGIKTLASLRSPKSLFDTLPIASFSGKGKNDLHAVDDVFIPIPLKKEVAVLYRMDYLNTTSEQMLKDYIARFKV